MDGVVTVMRSAGQFQVVIGNHVSHVYEEVVDYAGIAPTEVVEDDGEKVNLFNRLIDILSGVFQPFLGVLAASGMLKGFVALAFSLGLITQESDTYILLNQIGDAIFFFMPIVIGYTASQKFKLSPVIGMTLGMGLVMPTLQLNAVKQLLQPLKKFQK